MLPEYALLVPLTRGIPEAQIDERNDRVTRRRRDFLLRQRAGAAPSQARAGAVARHEGGELRLEEFLVVLLDLEVDLERSMTERRRASFARGTRGRVERLLAVTDPGWHRHAQHGRIEAGLADHV